MGEQQEKLRLDKWLWAARFFKTRRLAREAIEGGKVHCESQRVKPGKVVEIGLVLKIRQGFAEKEVVVKGLNHQRRPASEAQMLYEETALSIAKREKEASMRSAAATIISERKPDKKSRREVHRFKRGLD